MQTCITTSLSSLANRLPFLQAGVASYCGVALKGKALVPISNLIFLSIRRACLHNLMCKQFSEESILDLTSGTYDSLTSPRIISM